MHGQEGKGEEKEGFLKKEGAQVCGTQKMCPTRESWSLGFSVLQFVPHDHIYGKEGEGTQRQCPLRKEVSSCFVGEVGVSDFLCLNLCFKILLMTT